MPTSLNFGAFNVRGINQNWEKKNLEEDAIRYGLDIVAVTETHIGGESNTFEQGQYVLYTVNGVESKNTHGTGILVKKGLNPSFQRVTERICTAHIKLTHTTLVFISTYAHTSEKAKANPELREDFYEAIESIISKLPNRYEVVLAGDFNAKTGSGYRDFRENMGSFGKGEINESGIRLPEACKRLDLIISNTLFNHKLCHRTTRTAPFREFNTHKGDKRRNPVRNRID